MCRVNSLFNMYNGLFLSTTVIHRTWLDKINSKDYHFAKELISTLCSHGKYERVKCNTDKLLNITALNMTVTRLPANLASKKHNFPLRGIMCAWSNHSFYFLQSKKWLRRTYALRKKKRLDNSQDASGTIEVIWVHVGLFPVSSANFVQGLVTRPRYFMVTWRM